MACAATLKSPLRQGTWCPRSRGVAGRARSPVSVLREVSKGQSDCRRTWQLPASGHLGKRRSRGSRHRAEVQRRSRWSLRSKAGRCLVGSAKGGVLRPRTPSSDPCGEKAARTLPSPAARVLTSCRVCKSQIASPPIAPFADREPMAIVGDCERGDGVSFLTERRQRIALAFLPEVSPLPAAQVALATSRSVAIRATLCARPRLFTSSDCWARFISEAYAFCREASSSSSACLRSRVSFSRAFSAWPRSSMATFRCSASAVRAASASRSARVARTACQVLATMPSNKAVETSTPVPRATRFRRANLRKR